MTPEEIKARIGDLQWMSLEQGKEITSFIQRHEIRDVLELGCYHGVSTCYLAAAVPEGGTVTTLDREEIRALKPNVEQLLRDCGLNDRVTVLYEPRTYTWRLMKMLEADATPRFDLCFIDGSHQWAVDGFAFFLADRLLREGGWMIFDDLDWKVATDPVAQKAEYRLKMTPEERDTAQIRKVYELLVKTHPDYAEFRQEGAWAYAKKRRARARGEIQTETVVRQVPVPWEMIRKRMKRDR